MNVPWSAEIQRLADLVKEKRIAATALAEQDMPCDEAARMWLIICRDRAQASLENAEYALSRQMVDEAL